jgi:cadmium resistance transport/sequestration family protein
MERLFGAILVGITAFVATNLDDIVVFLLFFSQVSDTFRRRHIVGGQYLGFLVLLMLSLPGYFSGLVLSKAWVGLLGLLPIWIGINQLRNKDTENPELQTVSSKVVLEQKASILTWATSILHPNTYQVAAVTVANGGDNLGIYIPLFASNSLPRLTVIVSVFLILVGVWCWIAQQLTRQRAIAQMLSRYGHRVIPFVLMGLGLYILVNSGTLAGVLSWISSSR